MMRGVAAQCSPCSLARVRAATTAARSTPASMRGSRASTSPTSCAPAVRRARPPATACSKVGVAKRAWTPQDFETYTDENNDREWQTTEPYTDLNGNGKFDGVWLFGGGRAALGVTTDVEARAMAFVAGRHDGRRSSYVDCVGMLVGDMDMIRSDPTLAGLDIDHIIDRRDARARRARHRSACGDRPSASTGRQPFVLERAARRGRRGDQGSGRDRAAGAAA